MEFELINSRIAKPYDIDTDVSVVIDQKLPIYVLCLHEHNTDALINIIYTNDKSIIKKLDINRNVNHDDIVIKMASKWIKNNREIVENYVKEKTEKPIEAMFLNIVKSILQPEWEIIEAIQYDYETEMKYDETMQILNKLPCEFPYKNIPDRPHNIVAKIKRVSDNKICIVKGPWVDKSEIDNMKKSDVAPKIIDIIKDKYRQLVIMEYLPHTLIEFSKACTWNTFWTISSKCIDALESIHNSEFYHMDIAPVNICIKEDLSICIIDYDQSRNMITGNRDLSWNVPSRERYVHLKFKKFTRVHIAHEYESLMYSLLDCVRLKKGLSLLKGDKQSKLNWIKLENEENDPETKLRKIIKMLTSKSWEKSDKLNLNDMKQILEQDSL